MKPGPGDFRRVAEIGHVEPADDLGGDFARGAAQLLAQRHGAIGLVVAVAWILADAHHVDQCGQIGRRGQRRQGRGKTMAQFRQNIHAGGCDPSGAGLPGTAVRRSRFRQGTGPSGCLFSFRC